MSVVIKTMREIEKEFQLIVSLQLPLSVLLPQKHSTLESIVNVNILNEDLEIVRIEKSKYGPTFFLQSFSFSVKSVIEVSTISLLPV